jgi:hypothetical protein
MPEIADPATLDLLVTRVVDQAGARLKAAAADAKKRVKTLDDAKTDAGNRIRANDIRASLGAETVHAADAGALAKSLTRAKQSMRADLDRLVAAAQGDDPATGG